MTHCATRLVLRQQPCQFHEVELKAQFEGRIAMDRNRNADRAASLGVDMVTAADALQRPSVRHEQAGEFLAGKCLHSTNSIT